MLQEEQRQLQAKKKSKQALLDELVRCWMYICQQSGRSQSKRTGKELSHYDRWSMPDKRTHTHRLTNMLSLRVHGCVIIKSLLPVIVLLAALFSFCDSKASWLHCVELRALEVIVPAERAAEAPSQIAG